MPRYEVFGRRGSGEPMHHVGSVDSPNPEMALAHARQNFSRRDEADELWIVDYADIRMFERSDVPAGLDKSYREIRSYADLGRRRRLVEANVPETRFGDSISSSGPDIPAAAALESGTSSPRSSEPDIPAS